jgi:hypothetical protein
VLVGCGTSFKEPINVQASLHSAKAAYCAAVLKEAVAERYIQSSPSRKQLSELIQIPPPVN